MWIQKLSRKKESSASEVMSTNLRRCLTTFDITLLGIGHMMGSGIYVLSPTVANTMTGPAIVVSYLVAGFASLLAALAYADFGVRYPRSGSAYSYIYYSLGEFWAFFVGWNVIMENVLATAACARACSAYIDSLTDHRIFNFTESVTGRMPEGVLSEAPDILAFIILVSYVIFMTFGVQATSGLNNALVCLNMVILAVLVGVGGYYADLNNWTYREGDKKPPNFINGFLPYGWHGVFKASASCFFAYVGFDAIAASGEEALTPQKSLPIATLASMFIVTTVYVLVSGVMTLMMFYADISPNSGLPEALAYHGAYWAQYIVSIGAIAGMSTVIMATVFAMARVGYAMAEDGLLLRCFAMVHPKTKIPLVSMYILTSFSAVVAMLFDIDVIIEMLSIGTLIAYLVVAFAVLVYKYTPVEQFIELQIESTYQTNGRPKLPESPGLHHKPINHYRQNKPDLSGEQTLKPSFKFMRSVLPRNFSQRTTVILSLIVVIAATLVMSVVGQNAPFNPWVVAVMVLCCLIIACCVLVIFAHEPCKTDGRYNMPLMPFLPILSIMINTFLMTTLMWITWIRLVVWVALGIVAYFAYGVRHSRLNV